MRYFLACLFLLACGNPEAPPTPPGGGGGGGGGGVGGGGGGGGMMDASVDAAIDGDAGVPAACTPIMAGDTDNRAVFSLDGEAVDFEPRSAIAAFEPAECADSPVLAISMGSDLVCGLRAVPYLRVRVPTSEIDLTVSPGVPINLEFNAGLVDVLAEIPSPTPVIYRADADCGVAVGSIRFESISSVPGVQTVEISASLPNCSDRDAPPLVIESRTSVMLMDNFSDVCIES